VEEYGEGREPTPRRCEKRVIRSPLLIVIIIIAVVLLFTGGFVESLSFLLWVGLVLLAIAVISFLIRAISGRR
jgi:hypothetical protein